jgi:ribosomal protein S18 acetylase RimI-like enzyme
MTSVVDIERAASSTWSPDERTMLAGWMLASSGGFTRRANCATPTGDSDPSPEMRAPVESWLAERGAALVVRVTPLADDQLVAQVTRSWGLDRADETVVMTKPLVGPIAGVLAVVDPGDPGFAAELLRMNNRSPDGIGAFTRMVLRLGSDAAGVWDEGRAVGLAAVAGDVAAVYSIAVGPAHRRRGLATDVTTTAEAWAVGRGATSAFVQVRVDNEAARTMYGKLGYEERYRYHYLQPQASPA